MTRVLSGPPLVASGGGRFNAPEDLITDEQREEIRKNIATNIENLRLEGKLAQTAIAAHPLFGWPLRLAPGLTDPGYYGLWMFVDMDLNFPGFLLDFNCGARTYDRSDGYNHQGTDFGTWPWGLLKMDRNEVEIVAVAPGQIVGRSDGNFDRSCAFNNNPWNAIYVQHADGSQALYGHMKSGSLTPKQVGDTVAEGEFLGVVGSSGNSTGPHLHLEVYDANGSLIDPWAGTCNYLNGMDSWWSSQRPYYDPAINRLTTGISPPTFDCPNAETTWAEATFPTGPIVYFTAYYRDHLGTLPSTYTVYRPDGTVFNQWSHSNPEPYYSTSWFWFSQSIPAGEPQGTWRFTVEFNSTTQERRFSIGTPEACGRVPETPAQGEVLRIEKLVDPQLRLTWGLSCNGADGDYVLYEGVIGDFTSHTKKQCGTSGSPVALVTPGAAGRYYLVGPRSSRQNVASTREGSLGLASGGVERPPAIGTGACNARNILPCP